MAKLEPIKDAAELLKSIMKPLLEILRAGRDGNGDKVQMYGHTLVEIFTRAGYLKEADLLSRNLF